MMMDKKNLRMLNSLLANKETKLSRTVLSQKVSVRNHSQL